MSAIDNLKTHLREGSFDDGYITNKAILELDARLKELTDRFNKHVGYWPENHPKPTPTDEELVQKYIDRCADENIIYMEHIDRHKVLMRQLIAEVRS